MSSALIKRTQEELGRYVKKPPLTEKLLSKPPFRFLHDVITSVMKSNPGVLEGLYTDEEMLSENVKDRDGKIRYLEKVRIKNLVRKILSLKTIVVVQINDISNMFYSFLS